MAGAIESIQLGFSRCYLIRGRDVVLIDGGMSGRAAHFKRGLDRLGIRPDGSSNPFLRGYET